MKILIIALSIFFHSISIAIEIPKIYKGKDVVTIFNDLELNLGDMVTVVGSDDFGYFKICRVGDDAFQLTLKLRETRNMQVNKEGALKIYSEYFYPVLEDVSFERDVSDAFAQNIRLRYFLNFANLFMVTEVEGKICKAVHFIVVSCKSDELRFLQNFIDVYVNDFNGINFEWRSFRGS